MSEAVTRRLRLVGRKYETKKIRQAIQGQRPRILFLEGEAGIGKTALLEEAGRIAQKRGALCPPVVDFYDTEIHAHRALEAAIASNLDPDQEIFSEYWAQQGQLVLEGKTLKGRQDELWELFLKGYARVIENQRVVLRFDTVERLEYEQDSEEVLRDCEVSAQDAPSWEWLMKRIGELTNTVTLIAARPTSTGLLKRRLMETHRGRVLLLEVAGFSLEETRAYFQAAGVERQVADDPEVVGKVHLLSEGRPILIALALDWLERGMWEPHIYPASLDQLTSWQAKSCEEEKAGARGAAWQKWDEVRRNFEIALVQRIRGLDHTGLDVAVKYAARARKGCDAELLSLLMGVTQEEVKELVEEMLNLSFVKRPRSPRQFFFMHDQMYDLVEKYIWRVDWPDYSEQTRLDKVIIAWYTGQIETLKKDIKASADWRERATLRRQQQLLIAERLHYQFDADPRLGYREYSHLDEEATASREYEWDGWLRNEALWFTSHRAWRHGEPNGAEPEAYPRRDPAWEKDGRVERSPAVEHDCRRRWINRYIARNEMAKAARIAEKLLQKSKEAPHPEEPELYRGGLQLALATAQAYMGGEFTEQALGNFQEGIQTFMNVPEEHREPWLYPHLLGTAYLYKGLALRGSLQLTEAAEAYSQSIRYYGKIDYQPGRAEAMNNLAYIYARQGWAEAAHDTCEKALSLRQELGDEYGVGLSLNTRGIIHERLDRPLDAIHDSQQALAFFKEINNERGIILAEINLGRSYRRKARGSEWEQRDEDFEAGKQYLEDAIYRQDQQGASADIFYRIEAHNELGCLYRDWAATSAEKGIKDRSRLLEFLATAEGHLNEAMGMATQGDQVFKGHAVQYVDCLEDLARVYYWRHKLGLPVSSWAKQREIDSPLQAMRDLLDEAKRLAEEHFKEWEELRFILGKIHHQYARLSREEAEASKDKLADAAQHYAQAAAFLESYSFDAPELSKTVSDACDWLCMLQPEEAEEQIRRMVSTLKGEERGSRRLEASVDRIVQPLLGVGWPKEAQEATHG